MYSADFFISKLNMKPHPEGGYFTKVYRSGYEITDDSFPCDFEGERALSSTIYFLLKSGQLSMFHQLRFDEVWFYHYGSPVHLHLIDEHGKYSLHTLGVDIDYGEQPQVLVPGKTIFAAKPKDKGGFSLVSNMVSPEFDFRDFVLINTNEICAKFPHLSNIVKSVIGEG